MDFHSMTISPANPEILYGWFQGRLYRTKDGGKSWEYPQARGLPKEGFCFGAPCLAAGGGDEKVVYAGTPRGLMVSRDFGETWTQAAEQLGAVAAIGIDSSNSHRLFAYAEKFGVALSQDGGKSWRPRNQGVNLSRHELIFAFAFDSRNSSHVYAATPHQVLRTSDEGQRWEKIL